ncbi:unnamed protein product [Sphagnum balticum]
MPLWHRLVHRDLKPDNILVKLVDSTSLNPSVADLMPHPVPFRIAKISDFGTAKIKHDSTAYSHQTIPIGTTMFMAPEAFDLPPDVEPPRRFHPMKTNVYIFGLICIALLTGKSSPFEKTKSAQSFKDSVREGKRPRIPHNCPSRLSALIQRCWDGNPHERPNFNHIRKQLRYIKGLLLTGTYVRMFLQCCPVYV